MVFYCFPRIIGRVHREGKAIHQNTAERERAREESKRERGQKERERGTEVEVRRGCQYENGKKDKGRQR